MMVLVDSSVLIDHFNGTMTPEVTQFQALAQQEPIATGDLMVCEILRGVRSERQYRRTREALLALHIARIVDIEISLLAADQYRSLRKRGITIRKTVDSLIAAFCITHDCHLLHSDRDFIPFHEHLGLKCV